MEARVAALEQIASAAVAALERIERRHEALAHEFRAEIGQLRTDMKDGFRDLRASIGPISGRCSASLLGGFAGMLGLMAHGFHWL